MRRCFIRQRIADERGSVVLWVVLLLAGTMIGLAALVYDGGRATTRQAEIIDVAWALAATAAAEASVNSSGVFVIDPVAAEDAVALSAMQWPDLTWVLVTEPTQATVTVRGTYETHMLNTVGVDEWEYEATRTAVAGGG